MNMDPFSSLKRPSFSDYTLCIFCQTRDQACNLSHPTDQGIDAVKHALILRKKFRDSNNIETIDRLQIAFDIGESFLWHRKYYSIFTHKNMIDRLKATQVPKTPTNNDSAIPGCSSAQRSLRKHVDPVNWNLYCHILCSTITSITQNGVQFIYQK